MIKKIEKIAEILIYLSLVSIVFVWVFVESVYSDGNVTVNATVSSTMVSCTMSTDTINIKGSAGTSLDNTEIASSTDDTKATLSSSGAIYLKVHDTGTTTGGGMQGPGNGFLESPTSTGPKPTSTLVTGQEGYGLQASTTSGTLLISSWYNYGSTTSAVAGILATPTASTTIASSGATISSQVVFLNLLASVAITTPGGAYSDTVYYTCSATP